MARLSVTFKDGVLHYQRLAGREWTAPESFAYQPNGWVTVSYRDGAVVAYPPGTIDMIIDFPTAEG